MNDKVVKEALKYHLANKLHEVWRLTRKQADGSFEPRIKKSEDEIWNEKHGTNEVDIANTEFINLPSNWQYENLEASKVAIDLVYDKLIDNKIITNVELEELGSKVHDKWLERNANNYDPKLIIPYEKLPKEEQKKDKNQIKAAILVINQYLNGLINIEDLCEEYQISYGKTI